MAHPWKQNKDWQPPFESHGKGQLIFVWAMAIVWNAISGPLTLMIPAEVAHGNHAALAGLMFPLIGVAIIAWAFRITREFKRYGQMELKLDPYPGAIGGHVGGTVVLPLAAGAEAAYTVSLICTKSYVRQSGGKRKRKSKEVWSITGPARALVQGAGIELSFRFDVPSDLPASAERRDTFHSWKVVIESDHDSVPLNRAFEIPVFATADTSHSIDFDSAALAAQAAERNVENALTSPSFARKLKSRLGLSIDVRADWIRLYFHPGRQKGMAAAMLMVGIPFMAIYGLPADDALATPFRYLFGLIGLLMTIYGLYIPCNSLDVRVNHAQASRIRSWFGLPIKRQSIDPRDLQEIAVEEGNATSTNNREIQYYRLVGRGPFGEFRFAETIEDRFFLEALKDEIRRFAGLSDSPKTL